MKHLRLHTVLVIVAAMAMLLSSCGPAATTAPTTAPAAPVATQAPAAPGATQAPAATEAPAAPAATQAPAASGGSNTLVIAMNIEDLVSLDPAVAQETTNQFIHANTYDTLVTFKPGAYDKPVGLLAESWDVSPDAKTFTFHLKKNIKFSSGNPLTAADVVFTWQRGKEVKVNSFFPDIDTVTAKDDYTVVATTKNPKADFVSEITAPTFGIMDSKVLQQHGGTDQPGADTKDTAKQWLDQNSAGTAAYVLTKWAQKSEVDLQANPNWWGGKPFFDKVVIKDVTDPTAMLQMVQTGDADLAWDLGVDLADTAKADPNLQVAVNQSLDTQYLAMTSSCKTKQYPETAAILCKSDVRHAIAYAVDYKGLIDAVLKGYAVHAPAVLPIGMSYIDPSKEIKTDPAKAKELLAKAGYPNGVSIDLTYSSNPQRDTIAAKLKNDFEAVGIKTNLRPLDPTVYLTAMRAQELPIAFGAWTPDYLDPSLWTDNYACIDVQIAHRMQYDNPKACALSKQIGTDTDPAKRQQDIAALQQIWLDDMPFFNLYQPQYIVVMSKDLKGFQYHPSRFMDLSAMSK